MHVASHYSIEELQQLQGRAAKPAMVLKLRVVILACQDWIAPRIAEALGQSARTIQQWIGNYHRGGFEGLRDRRSSNRRYLTAEQEQQLRQPLDAAAADPRGGFRHAGDLRPLIAQQFGVTYSLSGRYELLPRLG